MQKGSSERQPAAQLEALCLVLLALTGAQLIASYAMRWLLWQTTPLALLRSFMVHDLAVIAGFAGAGLGLALTARRWRPGHYLVLTVAWAVGLLHTGLLAVNYLVVVWLRAPLTLGWIESADLGRSATPLIMLGSVVTPQAVAGLAGALLLPVILLILARRLPQRPRAFAPAALALVTLACFLVAATGRPVPPDQWRDAVSNPAIELAVSMQRNEIRRLMERPDDGRADDYALRPAAPPLGGAAMPRQPHILVVVLESVGARAVQANIARLPTIARLAREGTSFPNASVAATTSTRSMFSLIYSRYPLLSYSAEPFAIESGYPEPFLRALRRGGYATVFVKGGDFAFESQGRMLRAGDTGPLQDDTTISCDHRVDHSTEQQPYQSWLSDRCTYATVENWFASQTGPRAAIVLPVSTHFPYTSEKGVTAPPRSQAAYVETLVNSDRLLGDMLERLAKRGIRPVVVFTGDHGEAFGEHGVMMHGQSMFEEEVAIPLILSGPGIPQARVDQRLAQMQDIAPTVLDIAGLPRPCGWQGLSLLREERRARAFAMAIKRKPFAGYREGDAKFIHDLREDEIVRYDLAADPDERRPQRVTAPEAKRVKDALAGWAQYNAVLYNHGKSPCTAPLRK